MKNRKFTLVLLLSAVTTFFVSCSDDDVETVTVTETVVETETVEVDSSMPVGDLTVSLSGNLVAESGTPTQGLVELGVDTEMLIGNVAGNGEMFIKLDAMPDAKYTHIILWCATANIPFGNVALN